MLDFLKRLFIGAVPLVQVKATEPPATVDINPTNFIPNFADRQNLISSDKASVASMPSRSEIEAKSSTHHRLTTFLEMLDKATSGTNTPSPAVVHLRREGEYVRDNCTSVDSALAYLGISDSPDDFQYIARKAVAHHLGVLENRIFFLSVLDRVPYAIAANSKVFKPGGDFMDAVFACDLKEDIAVVDRVYLSDPTSKLTMIGTLVHEGLHLKQKNLERAYKNKFLRSLIEGYQRHKEFEVISEMVKGESDFSFMLKNIIDNAYSASSPPHVDSPISTEDKLRFLFFESKDYHPSYKSEREHLVERILQADGGKDAMEDLHREVDTDKLKTVLSKMTSSESSFDLLSSFFNDLNKVFSSKYGSCRNVDLILARVTGYLLNDKQNFQALPDKLNGVKDILAIAFSQDSSYSASEALNVISDEMSNSISDASIKYIQDGNESEFKRGLNEIYSSAITLLKEKKEDDPFNDGYTSSRKAKVPDRTSKEILLKKLEKLYESKDDVEKRRNKLSCKLVLQELMSYNPEDLSLVDVLGRLDTCSTKIENGKAEIDIKYDLGGEVDIKQFPVEITNNLWVCKKEDLPPEYFSSHEIARFDNDDYFLVNTLNGSYEAFPNYKVDLLPFERSVSRLDGLYELGIEEVNIDDNKITFKEREFKPIPNVFLSSATTSQLLAAREHVFEKLKNMPHTYDFTERAEQAHLIYLLQQVEERLGTAL